MESPGSNVRSGESTDRLRSGQSHVARLYKLWTFERNYGSSTIEIRSESTKLGATTSSTFDQLHYDSTAIRDTCGRVREDRDSMHLAWDSSTFKDFGCFQKKFRLPTCPLSVISKNKYISSSLERFRRSALCNSWQVSWTRNYNRRANEQDLHSISDSVRHVPKEEVQRFVSISTGSGYSLRILVWGNSAYTLLGLFTLMRYDDINVKAIFMDIVARITGYLLVSVFDVLKA